MDGSRSLVFLVGAIEPGRKTEIRLWRDGKEKTLKLELARRADYDEARMSGWLRMAWPMRAGLTARR